MEKNEIENKIEMWLLKTRKSKGLDIRELSQRSGVAIGMISRIENGLSITTFSTVVRLCFGLGMGLESFSEQIGIDKIHHKQQILAEYSSYTLPSCLTVLDLEAFRLVYRFDITAARDDLIALWKTMLEMIELSERKNETGDNAGISYFELAFGPKVAVEITQKDIIRFQESERKIAKTRIGDGDALQIATAQINIATDRINRTPLEYPPVSNLYLGDVLSSGGVISLIDAGQYFKNLRLDNNKTLVELQDSLQISRNVLSRIENGEMERVRFSDIAIIDQLLDAKGEIISIFWAAFEYHTRIEATRLTQNRDTQITATLKDTTFQLDPFQETLIRIARWYRGYPLRHNDRLWLDQERKKWEMITIPTELYGQISPYDFTLTFNKAWEVFTPYLFRLCGAPRYPEDDTTDYIPQEVKELWGIFMEYVATDMVFDTLKNDLLGHPEDLDFVGGLRSQLKKAWWKNETLRAKIEQCLRRYYPEFMEEMVY